MAFVNSILSSPGTSMRNIDKIFEDAQLKGILQLNSRKLKEFPKVSCKYDLSDLVKADLSKNRLSELPTEICGCVLLEDLDCYNNVIRSVPDAVIQLQSLAYIDLSRNQLTVIPVAFCHLPLQVLNLRNNRLVSIPEEISAMKCLRDLDVSCNEITIVPPQLGCVTSLQRLNLKRNLLLEIPIELCHLRLVHLDVSANRISAIPTQLRFMTSLQDLILDHNPMTFPPAVLCKRGRIHVFKFLEIQAIKEDKRGIVLETEFHKFRSPSILSDSRLTNGFGPSSCCRKSYTFDSGYSTSDGDCRSQESQDLSGGFKKPSVESPRWETTGNLSIRNQNTNTLFNYIPSNGEEETPEVLSVQTFKEYKEALKKKREALNIYKKTEENGVELSPKLQVSKTKSTVASKQPLRRNEVPSVEESPRGNSSPLVNTSIDNLPKNIHVPNSEIDKVCFAEKKVLKLEEIGSSSVNKDSNQSNFAWPKNSLSVVKPSKSSFTMRRELDKAREEQELISQLREILESRLKLKLPADLESALNDGVFLCHLANNIRANSVTCIHVPSPTVPKLTVAKCRRNADNFLEACRRLGVPNAELQSWAEAFLHSKETFHTKDTSNSATEVIFSCFLLAIFVGTAIFLYEFPEME
ncbi:leucine-rich repeat and calponin homology domain-containing protein-like isoform X1 [Argiope bruennichi]|uniref:leucine-rich repeat and calponin homology domain-containing protein-like isoform X1 n=1 Tax=Argiope bruennichi TaxID=94029 RepID=UPI002495936C|nr:leucine-rich repeat and calponin homology domain-containing protein-like isoform X1 [Argiope bruennichi]